MTYIAVFNDDYLEHHGVKGMKWGVRRSRTARLYSEGSARRARGTSNSSSGGMTAEQRSARRKKIAKRIAIGVGATAAAAGAAYLGNRYLKSKGTSLQGLVGKAAVRSSGSMNRMRSGAKGVYANAKRGVVNSAAYGKAKTAAGKGRDAAIMGKLYGEHAAVVGKRKAQQLGNTIRDRGTDAAKHLGNRAKAASASAGYYANKAKDAARTGLRTAKNSRIAAGAYARSAGSAARGAANKVGNAARSAGSKAAANARGAAGWGKIIGGAYARSAGTAAKGAANKVGNAARSAGSRVQDAYKMNKLIDQYTKKKKRR